MDYRSILSNFSVALGAQGLSTLVGLLTSLIVPKLLGVADFGYWQLFIFYTTYLSLFTLGLNDGVYLIEGGKRRDETNKKQLASQFWVECGYQFIFAGIIVAVALSGVFDGDRSFVILMTAVYLLLNNCSNFFGYLFQAMNESKLYSISTIINCTCFLAPLLVMLVTGDSDFRHYVFFYAIARLASLGFSLWKGRDFLHAGLVDIQTSFRLAWKSIRAGSKLLLSTIAGSLILGIARFMVDANWGIEEFSIVSLAVSITAFVMTLVSQASMVLFPALRQAEKDEAVNFYLAASNALDVLLPLTYVLYAPMAALLTWWLPQYEASFTFFALLMPLCIFNSRMGVVGNTFLWVLRKESRLLAINIATLGISALFAVVGTFCFHSIGIVFGGAVLAVIVRSLYTEWYIGREFKVQKVSSMAGSIVITVCFAIATALLPLWTAWVVVAVICAIYSITNLKRFKWALNLLRA